MGGRFEAGSRAENGRDVELKAGNLTYLHVLDQTFRLNVESLLRGILIVETMDEKTMPFCKKYLVLRKKLDFAEKTNLTAKTPRNCESSNVFLPRVLKARFCEFVNLKTVDGPDAYMIRHRFIAGYQNPKHKMKSICSGKPMQHSKTLHWLINKVNKPFSLSRTNANLSEVFICQELKPTEQNLLARPLEIQNFLNFV